MRAIGLLILTSACVAAAPPARSTSQSASKPATRPVRIEEMEPLAEGNIRYLAPSMWKLVEKTPNGLSALYQSRDERATIAITVIPQDRTMIDSANQQMAMIIAKGIREAAARGKQQLVIPPKVEPDERFYLKMRDAMTSGGMTADRIQMYRIMGLNLVHVAATAQVHDLEESRDVHALAENLLDTMLLTRGAKRVVYPKAQLRVIVPLDWKETRKDDPNGLVATYVDPKDASRQIVLSARIIPKTAREDQQKRDALLERMVDQERMPKFEGKDVPAAEYLRQVRVTAVDTETRIDTRYLVVGDVLVSVRSSAKEADADAVGAIADKFATALKPIREPIKE